MISKYNYANQWAEVSDLISTCSQSSVYLIDWHGFQALKPANTLTTMTPWVKKNWITGGRDMEGAYVEGLLQRHSSVSLRLEGGLRVKY